MHIESDSTLMKDIPPLSERDRRTFNEKLREIDLFANYSYTDRDGRKFVCDGADVRMAIETALEWDRAVLKRDAKAFLRISFKFLTLPIVTGLIAGGFVLKKIEEEEADGNAD